MKSFAIFPGRFHPFHKGHKSVYDWLVNKFSANNVFISTSGVVDSIKSPFSFEEKKKMMEVSGIPSDKIIQVKNNYTLSAVADKIPIDINKDAIFFAVSEKDMAEDPRFKSFTKKDGTPSYLQMAPSEPSNVKPAITHGYLVIVPVKSFEILGKPIKSATELRALFSSLDEETKKRFIVGLFGKFDQSLLDIMDSKLADKRTGENIQESSDILTEDFDSDIAGLIKKRDTLDYQIEVLRLKKLADALKIQRDNQKNVENQGGDAAVSKNQTKAIEQEIRSARKRVSAANVKRSA